MRRFCLLLALSAFTVSCGRHPPPPEATAAVVPNLPIINPSRPVTEETLSTLETDFHKAASKVVAPYVAEARDIGGVPLEARVIRLFSKEKVLWMEVRMGPWWGGVDEKTKEDLLAEMGRILFALDEKAFNQARDVILTAKDSEGRRAGDVTVSPFSTNVRLTPASAGKR